MTLEGKKEIRPYITEDILEDIFFIVKLYGNYDEIFNVIEEKMGDYKVVKERKDGPLVVVAMHSINFEEFKSRVLL